MHKHLVLTASVKDPTKDPEVIKVFLAELVKVVNMVTFLPPVAKYCDDPGNAGVTGVVVITTSHASVHVWDTGLLQMDLYSCKEYDEMDVIKHIKVYFDIVNIDYQVIDRSPKWKLPSMN